MKLKINQFIAACFCFSVAMPVLAQSKPEPQNTDANSPSFSMGVRTWVMNWDSVKPYTLPDGRITAVSDSNGSSDAVISPFALVRMGDFGVSAGTMLKKDISLKDSFSSRSVGRKEFDVNGIYYINKEISTSIGYKNIQWNEPTGGGVDIYGLTASVNASVPISERLGFYGTVGVGKLTTKFIPVSGSYGTNYNLVETGLVYNTGAVVSSIKSSAITMGYRQQKIKTSGVTFPNGQTLDYTQNTNGLTLGFVVGF